MEQEQAKTESVESQERARVSTRARVLVLALELARDREMGVGEALSAVRLAAEAELAFELARVRAQAALDRAARATCEPALDPVAWPEQDRWEEEQAAVRAAGLDREFL